MAYRENKLGLLVRLNPKLAKVQIEAAYKKADDGEPGRVDEKAAGLLDIGKSSLKRYVATLEDAGLTVKRPSDDAEERPKKRAGRRA